jgi:hypothetical protein
MRWVGVASRNRGPSAMLWGRVALGMLLVVVVTLVVVAVAA